MIKRLLLLLLLDPRKMHPYLEWIALTALLFMGLWATDKTRLRRYLNIYGLCTALCVIGIAVFVASMLVFFRSNVMLDHIESTTIVTSNIWNQGGPIYHDLDSPQRYSMLYGPDHFIIEAAFLKALGGSIQIAKLPSTLFALASMFLLFWILKQETSITLALFGTGYYAICLGYFDAIAYWTRNDPEIIFWVCAGLGAMRIRRPIFASLVMGIVLGAAIGEKAHIALCFLPMLAVLARRDGWRWALIAMLIAGVTTILPFFLFSGVSLPNYIMWLRSAGKHHLLWDEFMNVLHFGGLMVLPLLSSAMILAISDFSALRQCLVNNWLVIAGLVFGLSLTIIAASKEGAGPHHLMPFVPLFAYGAAKLAHKQPLHTNKSWEGPLRQCGALAALLIVTPLAGYRQISEIRYVAKTSGQVNNLLREVEQVRAKYPGRTMEIGYGSELIPHYDWTFYRCVLTFEKQPLLLDGGALMDMNQAGIKIPEPTFNAIRNGTVNVWLIPTGETPFGLPTMYLPHGPLFGASFQQAFLECYKLQSKGEFFDVWQYRGGT